jgi:ceramide glucosyltransferase
MSGLALLSLALAARTAALTIGVGILDDRQVLRDQWLVPLRDCFGLALELLRGQPRSSLMATTTGVA